MNSVAEVVEKAVTTRMQDLHCKLEKYEEDKKTVMDVSVSSLVSLNVMLIKAQYFYLIFLQSIFLLLNISDSFFFF